MAQTFYVEDLKVSSLKLVFIFKVRVNTHAPEFRAKIAVSTHFKKKIDNKTNMEFVRSMTTRKSAFEFIMKGYRLSSKPASVCLFLLEVPCYCPAGSKRWPASAAAPLLQRLLEELFQSQMEDETGWLQRTRKGQKNETGRRGNHWRGAEVG